MKKLLLSAAIVAGSFGASAQLPNGSVAPDFTVTDINGNSHNLYTYLDQGYSVIIDMNATWCGPCWNYHQGGALETVWAEHGPTGGPGVNAGTTNDVIVMMIESDGSTTMADLQGTGSNTQGDWITGTDLIIVDDASVASAYNLAYYPTIYTICPNRIVTESGQQSAANHYAIVGDCPAPASDPADAAALSYDGETVVCGSGDYTPVVTIQNNGTNALTDATVTITVGGSTVSTGTFTGNLATYELAQVTCTAISGFAGGTLNITVTTTGDANASNGTLSQAVSSAVQAQGISCTVEIVTDAYGSETTWAIKNSAGTTVSSGGPYNDLSAAGTTPQTPVNVSLNPSECYTFVIYDSYGDGIDAGYGAGSYMVKDATGATLLSGGNFSDEETKAFKSGTSGVGIEENTITTLSAYPNPATSVVNVTFEAVNGDYTVSIIDLQGRVITSEVYSNLSGFQSVEMSVSELEAGNYFISVSNDGSSVKEMISVK